MTRGKYAVRAANREQTAEAVASEAGYQRQIVRLTQERDKARADLAKIKTDSAAEARKLRAQVSEGTSDLVEALRREVNRFRNERDALHRDAVDRSKKQGVLVERLCDHMVTEHGAKKGREATEQAMWLMSPEFDGVTIHDTGSEEKFAATHGVEALRALRRARGQA